MQNTYFMNDSLRIFDNGQNEIRFKLGVWNYNEALLDLTSESEELKKVIRIVINKLINNEILSNEFINYLEVSKDTKENILNILGALSSSGMIITKEQKDIKSQISMSLLGDYRYFMNNDLKANKEKKLLFITDNEYCKKMSKLLIEEMELNIDIASKEVFKKINSADLTTNIDVINTIYDLEDLIKEIGEYEGILLCFKNPHLSAIRNINRLAIKKEIPLICSFIDGPFITVLSTSAPKTGCLECFEQRNLTRMEDHLSYGAFEKIKFSNNEKQINKGIIPTLNVITNLIISEGFLLSNYGTSKFENRALNIYVPTLEIQVQDLLRVPYCPACGNVSKTKFKELNVSSRKIVNNIIDSLK